MKKLLFIAAAFMAVISCGENSKTGPVMSETEQQNQFKTIAESVLDQVDQESINNAIGEVMAISQIDVEKYADGSVVSGVMSAVEGMTTNKAGIEETVYNLYALRGKYSFINGQQSKSASSNSIEVNLENTYYLSVVFSSQTKKILTVTGSNEKIYVDLPVSTSITLSKNGTVLASLSYNLETNITDATNLPDMRYVTAIVSARLEFAGFAFELAKFGMADRQAAIVSGLSKSGCSIISETLTVDQVEFDGIQPCGAGKGTFELDILGQMQVKAGFDDISAFISNMNLAYSHTNDEATFKKYVAVMNSLMDTGVYFSTPIKQSWMELYPVLRGQSPYSYWTAIPVFVLADGTRFEDPTEFFSETYFRSVISKFESLLEYFSNIL